MYFTAITPTDTIRGSRPAVGRSIDLPPLNRPPGFHGRTEGSYYGCSHCILLRLAMRSPT